MLLCFFSLKFHTLLARFHAASRAPCSCHSVSSWDRSSNFGALGLRWWGSPGQIIPSDGFWSRMIAWSTTTFVNFTRRIGFRMSELFRKIDEDFGGAISWNTQPNCRVFDERSYTTGLPCFMMTLILLQHSHCTFVHHSFWTFCQAVLQPGGAHKSTFHQICNHSWSSRTSILEGATFHSMNWCKFLWGNPCGAAIETFFHWDFGLWDFWFSMNFHHSAA